MSNTALPLVGRTALITGVSRRRGIAFAVARRLASDGANVVVSHFSPHDESQPWGSDDLEAVRAGVRERLVEGAAFADFSADLEAPDAPERLVRRALEVTGSLDILVCTQARSGSDGSLLDMTARMLDGHYAVNARATLLLTKAFAEAFANVAASPHARPGDVAEASALHDERETGRVVWFTSGQARPMPGEIPYAASKAMLAGLVPSVAHELVRRGILLTAINPGPVNTGYLDAVTLDRSPEVVESVRAAMPLGRFGHPDDVARLVSWLVGPEGRWMTGQVLTQDGGFSL